MKKLILSIAVVVLISSPLVSFAATPTYESQLKQVQMLIVKLQRLERILKREVQKQQTTQLRRKVDMLPLQTPCEGNWLPACAQA